MMPVGSIDLPLSGFHLTVSYCTESRPEGGTVHVIGKRRKGRRVLAKASVVIAVVATTLVALVGTAHAIAWGGPTM
jgi:hypothetical protein